nr:hypothetical protein [Tanacetum cinerariifolium]
SITRPKGVSEDVFVKVGKFHFLTDFVVVDFEADPRAPLILGRYFLRTGRALIDVYGEEITLRVNDESITFNLSQTMRYSLTYDDTSVNRVDVIDVACEDFMQDVLDFQYNPKSSNPTLVSDDLISESDSSKVPIVKSSSPILTSFVETEELKEKSSVEEPPELELKELPSHLEFAFLEDSNKLPVIIAKNLKVDEREALLNVLKTHKRAIAWKISNIEGIDPWFCTHKILIEDDYKPTVQSQRRVNPKIHDVIKKEVIKLLDAGMIYPISDSPWTMEVFMDDFSVFGDSFSSCLTNLDKMLNRCEETNLVLNWEKCHFMCKEGIVLGHKISKSGIEVDRAKVDVIAKLPHPTTVKGVRSFLGHAGFYRYFIQDFSEIARPMTHLLKKETPFVFSKECVQNPFYLKQAKRAQPILYDGNELLKTHHVPVLVTLSEEDLELAETTRINMNEKMNDHVCVEKRVKITPPNYSKENFMATFTPHAQLTPKQVFWSKEINDKKADGLKVRTSPLPILPPATMYPPNTPIHLVPRTLPTTSQVNIGLYDVFFTITDSTMTASRFHELSTTYIVAMNHVVELEAEDSKFLEKIKNDDHDTMVKAFSKLEVAHLNLQLKHQHLKESIENFKSKSSKDVLEFNAFFELGKRDDQIQAHKNTIRKMPCVTSNDATPKVPACAKYAIDVQPIPPRQRKNRVVHHYYLNGLRDTLDTLREIVEEAISKRPSDNNLDYAHVYTKRPQELLENVVQIVLWYLDSGCSKHMIEDRSRLKNFMKKFIRTVRFKNDHFGAIMGYGDYVLDDSVIFRAEAVATACYTQNRSLIHTLHNKTPYELVHDKKPDLSFLLVFGALCYPTNDSEDLSKLKAKSDIGLFVGYAPNRKGYRIYNKLTRQIMETIHVTFDELTGQTVPVQTSKDIAKNHQKLVKTRQYWTQDYSKLAFVLITRYGSPLIVYRLKSYRECMRTHFNFYPSNSTANIPKRSNRRLIPNIVEPEIRTIAEIILMTDRTMEELLQAPTEGYGEAIVILEILAENFEIKTNLLQLVQANKFHGRENDNPHTHISNFKRMTATLKYRDVPNDAIKLMLFSYSLEDRARI